MGRERTKQSMSEEEKRFCVHVGARICAARKHRRMMTAELAEAMGVSETQLYWYEVGRTRVSLYRLMRFSVVLQVPLEKLLPRPTES